ncbi:MAG: hydroxyacylglutathione hydrolase [Gammaproteobacteria bacterium]|nr:hydroxyacylglutathione hydrolase [Gammaproteobacteria bacterium]NBT44280.1 hydroxyacylglutathione hydrolase [Gammaproteobacteria bacterium]NBY21747.1 hydroxyacylglutathione hydrolase [Gammaproteobacteria bacterium]
MKDITLSSLEIVQIPVLRDNYVYLLHDVATGSTAVVDPSVPEPVLDQLSERGLTLSLILNTHHHGDHVGANLALKAATGCSVVGKAAPEETIPGLDLSVVEGDLVTLGASTLRVLELPGHTRHHIAFWSKAHRSVFVGDTLFALGCGRLLGGSALDLFQSLQKLKDLPSETLVYCAHEYTQSNGAFALTVDPRNEALALRMQGVHEARERGQPTVPSTLSQEFATNPFLRTDDPLIKAAVGVMEETPEEEVFRQLRAMKDDFKAG